MGPPVARIAVLRGFGANRTLFAEADGSEFIARNAERDERIFGGGGAAIAQGEVVFSGSTLVTMAFNRDDEVGIHLEDRFQGARISLKNGLVFAANIAFVVIEVDILDLFGENFLHRGGVLTVTVASASEVPAALVAVRWYVVVAVGYTPRRPLGLTSPIPLSILMLVASVTDHRRDDGWPTVTVVGSALKYPIPGFPAGAVFSGKGAGACGGAGGTFL
jgi:hypothetical protein